MNADDPQFNRMLDWLEGRLSEEESAALEQELESADAARRAELSWLRAFLDASADFRDAAPPPALRERLRGSFRDFQASQPGGGFFQRIVAALTFDSQGQFAAVGIRSATAEGSRRQFLFETDIAEVVLNLQTAPEDGSLSLFGQIFPLGEISPDAFTIQVTDADETTDFGLAVSDELGEFLIRSLPEGVHRVLIEADGYQIILPEIDCSVRT